MKKLLPLVWLAIFSCTHKKRAEPIPETPTKYSRAEFDHWIDDDHDCQNTRQEMLVARSLVPVTFTAKAKKKKCTVKTGQWKDFYFHEVLENAQEVDVDHVVPLKHAWDVGAYAWNEAKRREFANDPENLVPTNRKYNRQKGAKTILEWMPVDRAYACKYVAQWFRIKEKYVLSISDQEKEYRAMLKCH